MVELEENFANLKKQGYGVAAISYDSPAVLAAFASRRQITFPLLSDSDSAVIRRFGLLNEEVPKASGFYGIPYPVTLVVDASGRVSARYFEKDYRQRDTVSDILVRQFGQAGMPNSGSAATRYLDAQWKASTSIARVGQKIALVLDLDLKPNMHVYAPGVEGYKPVEWLMSDSPAWQATPVEFPPSRMLRLDAIDETVPVYQGKVHLVREIRFAAGKQLKEAAGPDGRVILKGTFRFQACDDHTCYLPQTLALEWALRFEDMDLERAPQQLQRKLN